MKEAKMFSWIDMFCSDLQIIILAYLSPAPKLPFLSKPSSLLEPSWILFPLTPGSLESNSKIWRHPQEYYDGKQNSLTEIIIEKKTKNLQEEGKL